MTSDWNNSSTLWFLTRSGLWMLIFPYWKIMTSHTRKWAEKFWVSGMTWFLTAPDSQVLVLREQDGHPTCRDPAAHTGLVDHILRVDPDSVLEVGVICHCRVVVGVQPQPQPRPQVKNGGQAQAWRRFFCFLCVFAYCFCNRQFYQSSKILFSMYQCCRVDLLEKT